MKKLKNTLLVLLLLSSVLVTQAQTNFSSWSSSGTNFTTNTNGTATYSQPSGSFRETIISPVFLYAQGLINSQSISFDISGFTNGGYNSCNLKPQMSIKLLTENGVFVSNIDSFEMSNSTRTFNANIPTTGNYKISLTITTVGCNNNSLPTITLGNLVVPQILLPVIFTETKTTLGSQNILLEWSTTEELQVSHYEIEKFDSDSESWLLIETVSSKRESATNSYSYTDNSIVVGQNAYRIKQVDDNGNYNYSEILLQLNTKPVVNTINIFPNPTQNSVTVTVSDYKNTKVYNNMGVLLLESVQETIDINDFKYGYYIFLVEDTLGNLYRSTVYKN